MSAPSFLVDAVQPWADLYGSHTLVATAVTFVHVGALLLGGGVAVATDRGTLRAMRRAAADRDSHLEELATVHRVVLTGLSLALVSGLLLLASDLETFFGSWVFWTKLTLVAALLANGAAMTKTESALRSAGSDAAVEASSWDRLRRSAVVSLALWFLITLAGVGLVNV